MKKYLWLWIITAIVAGNACQQELNTEKEKEALIAVNEEERDAYFARDLGRLESIWQHEPTSRRVFTSSNAITELIGWQEIRANYEQDINNTEKWDNMKDVTASFSNYDIQIHGKTALVTHDIRWIGEYWGKEIDITQNRIAHFVREGGLWRLNLIIQMSVPNEDVMENKRTAALYHELKPENVDVILTEDFFGQNEQGRHTWDRENHRRYLSNGNYKRDSIFQQVAEGEWVATRFFREMLWSGDTVKIEAMHFKRFEDGKISEIWEYADSQQAE